MNLREKIKSEIDQHGPIPFSRYMHMCLYDPEFGYYSRLSEKFGKAGDFFTSSDVHAVFGRLLARQFEEMWRALGSPEIVELMELGPGRGLFARDVLDWSQKKFPEFFRTLHYRMVESSPVLREKLQITLDRFFNSGKASLAEIQCNSRCFESGPGIRDIAFLNQRTLAQQVPIIIFANEFFDALPVEVIGSRGELRVGLEQGHFVERWSQPTTNQLDYLDRYGVHPESAERVEAPLLAQDYMAKISRLVERGFIIVIDYGYTRAEQLAGRHRGTVMAYRQHSASANPYEAPGEQDITAHVNFTALASAAQQQAMQVENLITQSQFLMGIGEPSQFADAFEECRLPQERAKVTLQLKHLVTPSGMGETFHVLVASKGVDRTKISQLSGLQFGRSRL